MCLVVNCIGKTTYLVGIEFELSPEFFSDEIVDFDKDFFHTF